IAWFNPDGTLAWAKRAGGPFYGDNGLAITSLPDNSMALTGVYQNSATFGSSEPNETTLTAAGVFDIFVARFEP
ncbi:MAG: hypothetical protein ABIG42_06480, partial [bacterium]